MTSRKIMRCRGARGQPVLYNPHTVPTEVAQELEGIYGFRPKEAAGCLADVMISQRKGEFPPVAFMLIHKEVSSFSIESTVDRKEARRPRPLYSERAIIHGSNWCLLEAAATCDKQPRENQDVYSIPAAVKIMVSVHEKLAYQISEKADQLEKSMNEELLTRKHAMDTLQTSFPFLSVDECDMLLDLFGNIASIAQAGAEKLLDVTVLSTSAAYAIEEFFKTEYVVDMKRANSRKCENYNSLTFASHGTEDIILRQQHALPKVKRAAMLSRSTQKTLGRHEVDVAFFSDRINNAMLSSRSTHLL